MHKSRLRSIRVTVMVIAASLLLGACVQVSPAGNADPTSSADPAAAAPATTPAAGTAQGTTVAAGSLFDDTMVHAVSLSFDEANYDAMLSTYTESGDKEWIEATVTVDGATYQGAGIRLKGNSSLRGLTGGGPTAEATTTEAETLPWLVSLDHFVDGQNHQGITDFVVRSNSSETALNEALALDLLERAGLAAEDAVAVRLSVNGGAEVLRLVIEHPDDAWMSERLDTTGALYKAESTGDYSYRGEDQAAYDEVFDQEAGEDNADLTPLIDFLDFINNSDDATFAAEIEQRLDVDSFATYLAMQELLQNFDDIDGPGNNSYLYYDTATGQFTVVPWDYNLAFGAQMGGPGRPGGQDGPFGGEPPTDIPMPSGDPPFIVDGNPPQDMGPGGGPRGKANILVERFQAIDQYTDLIAAKQAELEAQLFSSGVAADELADWVSLLKSQAGDLVDAGTVDSEAAQISAGFASN